MILLQMIMPLVVILRVRRKYMALFGFKTEDINKGYSEYLERGDALLVDVRGEDEYARGHIPGSLNVPLPRVSQLGELADKKTPVYVYCLSGARSTRAKHELCRIGFEDVRNIGGISSYKGQMEVGA